MTLSFSENMAGAERIKHKEFNLIQNLLHGFSLSVRSQLLPGLQSPDLNRPLSLGLDYTPGKRNKTKPRTGR